MPEIRVLPLRTLGSDQVDRLHADLAAAHLRGEDLGSRVPHIQAGGERLRQMCHEIEALLTKLDQQTIALSEQERATQDALRLLLGAAQPLADAARRLSSNH